MIPSRPTLLLPEWEAPSTVGAFMTTRETGPSRAPYTAFNPAMHVGDDAETVSLCRQLISDEIGDDRPILWLDQVHGTTVQRRFETAPKADAAIAYDAEYACAVMTADCLPLFICDGAGTQVSVVHAGWRGLRDGVIEAAIDAFEADPADLLVWLGPAISNAQFEVGEEVREAFLEVQPEAFKAFDPSPYRLKHYMGDLYKLARQRLTGLGVHRISGGHFCTASDERFYSYRRDGVTGRMASVIWLAR
ncbi:peptidoglycan editing factor PgeF [Larsenimonas suaedae]|uniref:Purine nucleoside phosphorylase n=1 Tax=Larsenimonas suaedae TaxID=1851019 RepID=A0ABU1GYN1_9GAMM|nr:peptidoglycan editing factor PgeF [Larsenimonas suaedae]MCM2973715.1 peptidoglycan editing factor PgeF [Larsenimonas suaedae]MDR5897151.1 peptidoglycan editing factor PgeF [Larsenimonas suaedae]